MKHTYQYRFTFKKDGNILFETYYGYDNLRTILESNTALSPSDCVDILIKRRQAEGYELITYYNELQSRLSRYYIEDNEGCMFYCTHEFDDVPHLLENVLEDIPELYQNYSDFKHWFYSLHASWQEITVGLLNHEAWCDDIAKYVQIEYK